MTLEKMLEEIRNEANVRASDDAEWIIDAYNHLFGADYDIDNCE